MPETTTAAPAVRRIHLSAAGVSLLLDMTGGRAPAAIHWGPALGALTASDAEALTAVAVEPVPHNAVDVPVRVALLPQLADGWLGRPGLTGARADGSGFSPLLMVTGVSVEATGDDGVTGDPEADELVTAGAATVRIDLADDAIGLAVGLDVEMTAAGVVRLRARVTNTGEDDYVLAHVTPALPVPLDADEVLDFAGRWTKERTPQRAPLDVGLRLRENRRGRTGPDAAHVLHAGTAGFSFEQGRVWAVHTGFSGDHVHYAEKISSGKQVIGGGELLLAGEGRLAPGAAYTSPWVYAAYAADGLDTIARRFHRLLRARPQHVSTDRPVTLNVWEAVYFDHDLARLTELADRAADLGVERFVLDDGWFGSRRNDHSGLGDWVVSADVWPDGLGPLVDHVTGLGMQFGLWFEPEMVNEDSDVARAHPEWIMGPSPDRLPLESRHQQVLNLSIPEAWDHVHDQMDAILSQYDIAYIKWDHNRDLLESATRATGAAATHEQTLAAYRLMDALKRDHPGLEIETCASGGARVDLGVLERTDRVWVSDCIDPLERQQMNRWTSQLVPLELMGTHVASGRSHTTGRLHDLSFRAASALFGHLGIEWDLSQANETEIAELRAWIALYKEHRELLFTGDLVRVDRGEDSLWEFGVVAADRSSALFELACVTRSDVAPLGRVRFPGLDPEARYRLRPIVVGPAPTGLAWPAWARKGADPATDRVLPPGGGDPELTDGVVLPGCALVSSGVTAPLMDPETAVLFELTRVNRAAS
ncbi:alpha-galactosidase [Brachybacterium huguangmaarense]